MRRRGSRRADVSAGTPACRRRTRCRRRSLRSAAAASVSRARRTRGRRCVSSQAAVGHDDDARRAGGRPRCPRPSWRIGAPSRSPRPRGGARHGFGSSFGSASARSQLRPGTPRVRARDSEMSAYGQELRERRRHDGLAPVEVLVELDGVRRLGDVVDQERDDADVEVPEELRHLVVGPLAQEPHVRARGDGREIDVEVAAGEHEGRVGMRVGDLRQERHVDPRGERSVVADDRAGDAPASRAFSP